VKNPLEARWIPEELAEREQALEAQIAEEEQSYAGLKDLDAVLSLVKLKLQISLRLVEHIERERPGQESELYLAARTRARESLRLLEELNRTNVSLDQEEVIRDDPGYQEARELFQELLLRGGAGFFEDREQDQRKAKLLASAVTEALAKYCEPDDDYRQLFKTENLPPALRKVMEFLFPILARPHQKQPPYGIPEGQELVYRSEKIQLPLSQAVHYIEEQVLPSLRKMLAENPGSRQLQERIAGLEKRVQEYRRLKFFPRSTPVLLEHNFYTDGLSGYTADGELLVTVSVPVEFRSGTNVTRVQTMVQAEVVRRIAGKGVSPEIDAEYGWLKRIESGIRGSSRTPSFKIKAARAFGMLKSRFPVLKSLDDRKTFQELLDHYQKHGRKATRLLLTDSILNRTVHPNRFLE